MNGHMTAYLPPGGGLQVRVLPGAAFFADNKKATLLEAARSDAVGQSAAGKS
jgi:hypothetical protein